jgi:hypothetical protein
MILIYVVFVAFKIILWLIKRKNINFGKIKFSIIIGVFCWGVFVATIMNLFINNPFKLYYAIINYVVYMVGGFIWGIVVYSLTKKIIKRKEERIELLRKK